VRCPAKRYNAWSPKTKVVIERMIVEILGIPKYGFFFWLFEG
jgi:hypothetical protein